MKTLSEIQTLARIYARNQNLDLTTSGSNGLATANLVYRQLASMLPWPELRRVDTSLVTVADQEEYDWLDTSVATYQNVVTLELQDGDNNDKYEIITLSPDEVTWNESGHKTAQAIPDHYVMFSTNILNRIAFRPVPKYAKTIKITGIIEPEELLEGNSKVAFTTKSAGDALAFMIASTWLNINGKQDLGQQTFQQAVAILRTLFDDDVISTGQLSSIVSGPND